MSAGWLMVSAGLLVLAVFSAVVSLLAKSSLTVQPDGVSQQLELGGMKFASRQMTLADIEEVRVNTDLDRQPRLEIAGDKGRLVFAHQKLNAAALENIRDRVVATLAGRG